MSVKQIVLEPKTGPSPAARSSVRTALVVLTLAVLFAAVLFIRGWRPMSSDSTPRPASSATVPAMPTSPTIEAKYGVRFLGVDVTAGGGMIQVRYQVLDSDKTDAIHSADLTPFVVDSHGTKYADPGMVGHSHVTKSKSPGMTDYILLANAGGTVQRGSVVTIKVGDLELRNVPVL